MGTCIYYYYYYYVLSTSYPSARFEKNRPDIEVTGTQWLDAIDQLCLCSLPCSSGRRRRRREWPIVLFINTTAGNRVVAHNDACIGAWKKKKKWNSVRKKIQLTRSRHSTACTTMYIIYTRPFRFFRPSQRIFQSSIAHECTILTVTGSSSYPRCNDRWRETPRSI